MTKSQLENKIKELEIKIEVLENIIASMHKINNPPYIPYIPYPDQPYTPPYITWC